MPTWVLGLDGGGTKTSLALVNRDGDVHGLFTASGINPFDKRDWQATLYEVLGKANAVEQIAHACFGMPGFGEAEEISGAQAQAVHAWARTRPVTLLNDVEVAFAGAFKDEPGILILAGTGSMVWGRDDQQTCVRVGGWGELIGDEGSAFWVGMQALQQLTWNLDGRSQDPIFLQALQKATHTRDGDELLRWCYGLNHLRSQVAQLAPTVSQLAEAGNATAQCILEEAAQHLWAQAQAAKQRLIFTNSVTYSYAGGMFRSGIIRNSLKSSAEQEGRWLEPMLPPLGGALWQAAKNAGWDITQEWCQKIKEQLQEMENVNERN